MRILCILLNVILFAVVVFLVANDGWPRKIEQQLMVCIFFATPAFSLITLWGLKFDNSDSWLSLYLQRKKLEEKTKLEKLKNSEG
ncbi:hypothetical protein JWG39_03620 [Desulforhopalus vacuolatus]|uniref:hypothetical protein n=1 Tax=Desulforhopalus vacuolatus TaxID=40414 RepID=UPI001965F20C|nr:hypothetical protein [Desulforhopalus vacuolatus]MBM9518902.1 hypothetical protein [Desulforhopalus vacuolatus]